VPHISANTAFGVMLFVLSILKRASGRGAKAVFFGADA
jgi:hypothetical protein